MKAEVNGGEKGNINLNIDESLLLRRESLIKANATSISVGGNININSPVIAGFENSDIIANAMKGNGGNIELTTQGIFGLEFRNELTEESDITASSQFGLSGTVEINNLSIDPSSGIVSLPVKLSDSSQQIATGCTNKAYSSFVATGKGGIPQNPNERVDASLSWSDIRDLSAYQNNNSFLTSISNKPVIIEATGFIRNSSGEIELVAAGDKPFITDSKLDCSGYST